MLSLFIIRIYHELSENLELLLKFYEHGFFLDFWNQIWLLAALELSVTQKYSWYWEYQDNWTVNPEQWDSASKSQP